MTISPIVLLNSPGNCYKDLEEDIGAVKNILLSPQGNSTKLNSETPWIPQKDGQDERAWVAINFQKPIRLSSILFQGDETGGLVAFAVKVQTVGDSQLAFLTDKDGEKEASRFLLKGTCSSIYIF